MQYTKLGRTGLDVSRLCLGCMSYGEPDRGSHTWTLGEDARDRVAGAAAARRGNDELDRLAGLRPVLGEHRAGDGEAEQREHCREKRASGHR
jgi:hypothetical protein